MTDHINLGVTLLMNEQFFQSMPEEYQQVILDVMREIADEQQQNTVSQQEGAVEQLKAEGVTVIEIDKEACQEACMTTWDKYAAEVENGQDIIDAILAVE